MYMYIPSIYNVYVCTHTMLILKEDSLLYYYTFPQKKVPVQWAFFFLGEAVWPSG